MEPGHGTCYETSLNISVYQTEGHMSYESVPLMLYTLGIFLAVAVIYINWREQSEDNRSSTENGPETAH